MTFHDASGSTANLEDGDPRPACVAMFQAVRTFLLGEGRAAAMTASVGLNPKGEMTRAFDAEAERIALDVARTYLSGFIALSEEGGETSHGENPRWRLVIDPCDGSNNFRRGIRSVGFSVAALPVEASLDPDQVLYAVCGDVYTGTVYSAARNGGATVDMLPCHASDISDIRHAMLGVNIGKDGPARHRRDAEEEERLTRRVWQILGEVVTVRRTGASVLDLCYVAQGAYSAYLDLRERLTPENFMAAALIIHESGGCFTDARGVPLGTVEFTQPYSVLAAGNTKLLQSLLEMLHAQ